MKAKITSGYDIIRTVEQTTENVARYTVKAKGLFRPENLLQPCTSEIILSSSDSSIVTVKSTIAI